MKINLPDYTQQISINTVIEVLSKLGEEEVEWINKKAQIVTTQALLLYKPYITFRKYHLSAMPLF